MDRFMKIVPTKQERTLIKKLVKFITSPKGLVTIVIILLLLILFPIYNPLATIQNIQNQQLISQVLGKATNTYAETPIVARIVDIDALTKDNPINAQIYKDAENGDFVLIFTKGLIIYKPSEEKIVYEGDNPAVTLQKNQELLISNIQEVAKSAGLIEESSTEIPQLSLVTDPELLRGQNLSNSDFYKDVIKDDIIVFFVQAGRAAIYRSSTGEFISQGNYQISIHPL
jgi:hypothetical protein